MITSFQWLALACLAILLMSFGTWIMIDAGRCRRKL